MFCPRTGTPLKEIDIQNVKVDISESSGGVWFDNFELQKFDEAHESAGEELLKLMEKYKSESKYSEPLNDQRLKCPRHPDILMMRHFYSSKKKVEIDECPKCGGIWLDAGELMAIREEFASEDLKIKAGREFIDSVFEKVEKESKVNEKKQRTKRSILSKILGFSLGGFKSPKS